MSRRHNWAVLVLAAVFAVGVFTGRKSVELRREAAVGMIIKDTAKSLKEEEYHLLSVLILRDGGKVAEYHADPQFEHARRGINSVSKGFTSIAIGFAVQEGLIAVTDRVADILPVAAGAELDEKLAALTVRDLLMMRSGYSREQYIEARSGDWQLTPPQYTPGERFLYSSIDCDLLSAIITEKTGMSMKEYLVANLFAPMEIGCDWQLANTITPGGGGARMTLEELGKIGEFYRARGVWRGKRLLNESWFEQATSNQSAEELTRADEWGYGYGYLFWLNSFGGFRSDGAGGQYLVIVPKHKLTIAAFSETNDLALFLKAIAQMVNELDQLN